jgi:MarR family 2-MHQ and catechol resistance regulon transcriptional repressor
MRHDPTTTSVRDLRSLRATIVRASRMLEEALNARLERAAGISLDEFDVLVDLQAADEGRLRMKDIGEHLLVSKTGVTRLVDRLEERGVVERAPCPTDRRVVWARITSAGRDLLAQAVPSADGAVGELIGARLGAEDVVSAQAALDRLFDGG